MEPYICNVNQETWIHKTKIDMNKKKMTLVRMEKNWAEIKAKWLWSLVTEKVWLNSWPDFSAVELNHLVTDAAWEIAKRNSNKSPHMIAWRWWARQLNSNSNSKAFQPESPKRFVSGNYRTQVTERSSLHLFHLNTAINKNDWMKMKIYWLPNSLEQPDSCW